MKFRLVEDINKKSSMLDIAKKLNIEEAPLTEAKADTQRLIDFAGEDLAKRFLNIRQRLKSPENDLYYWIKNKTPQELEQVVSEIENTKSKSQQKKEIDDGAKLVCETEHWKVYHITTFEASQKYGRDSKWCITGVNNYGDKYWKDYTNSGIKFYFLITKGEYDARGKDSKFAIALYPDKNGFCEVYNQQDVRCWLNDIPHYDEIEIPGVELFDDDDDVGVCDECGCLVDLSGFGGNAWGPDGELLCLDCFEEHCTYCANCDETIYKEDAIYTAYEEYVCERCLENHYYQCDECGYFYVSDDIAGESDDGGYICNNCITDEEEPVDESISHKIKFTLVEEFEELEEEVLNEKTDIYYELANYLMADMSNNSYTPSGFISHLNKRKRQELTDGLTKYVQQKYNLTEPKDIVNRVHEIMSAWVVHHINGIHPTSYNNSNNNSHNIALLDGINLHEKITQQYKEEIMKCVQNLPVQINDDVDKLLLRLIVVCKETGRDIKDILSIDMGGFEEALYGISDKLTQFFTTNYPRTRNDIIYLSDLNLSW